MEEHERNLRRRFDFGVYTGWVRQLYGSHFAHYFIKGKKTCDGKSLNGILIKVVVGNTKGKEIFPLKKVCPECLFLMGGKITASYIEANKLLDKEE